MKQKFLNSIDHFFDSFQTERLLNEEKSSDDALRQQFKEKWSRTPSDKLTEMFRTNLAKYREIINNAIQADKVVQQKFNTQRQYIEILSRGPGAIESALPSAGGSDSVTNTSAVITLREMMEEVIPLVSLSLFASNEMKIFKFVIH